MKAFFDKLINKISPHLSYITIILFILYTLTVLILKNIDVTYGLFLWIIIFILKCCIKEKLDMLGACSNLKYRRVILLELLPVLLLCPLLFAFCEIKSGDIKDMSTISILIKTIKGCLLMAILFAFYNGYTKKIKREIQSIIVVCTIIWLTIIGISFSLDSRVFNLVVILFGHSVICYLAIFIGLIGRDYTVREKRLGYKNYRCKCEKGKRKGSPTKIYKEFFKGFYIMVPKYKLFSFKESEKWSDLRKNLASIRDISDNERFIISNFFNNGVFKLWALAHDKTKKCINGYLNMDIALTVCFFITVLNVKEMGDWYVAIPLIICLHFLIRITYYLFIRVELFKEKYTLIFAILCMVLSIFIFFAADIIIFWKMIVLSLCTVDFLIKLYKCGVARQEVHDDENYIFFTKNVTDL